MRKIHVVKRNRPKEIYHLIVSEKRINMLEAKLVKYHAYDIATALSLMNKEERERLYRHLSSRKLALVFEQIDEEKASIFINELEKPLAVNVLAEMEKDDAIDILQELPKEESLEYLGLMDEDDRNRIRKLARYSDSTAGSEMNDSFIALNEDLDVKTAMKILVDKADETEMIDWLFIVDDEELLVGVLDLKALIIARQPTKIKEIMETNFRHVHVEDDIEEVVKDIQRHDILAMPVLNDYGQIEGVITMYDALDIIDEEAYDDYSKLAALPNLEGLDDSAFKNAKDRFVWLGILLILNLFVTAIFAIFNDTIAQIVTLIMFQPLILGMAGNVGTQSLAVTVLGISKETLQEKLDIKAHIFKEIGVALLNGMILSTLAFLIAYFRLELFPIGSTEPILIALVVALAVYSSLVLSSLFGSAIPLILNRLKLDPAIASGPFITTLNDILALIIYFGLASLIIIPLL
ncbi:MAG: magnesium transporter [Candidatus Izemoplasmataceae bacterium]